MRTIDDFQELVAMTKMHTSLFVRYSEGPKADAMSPSVDHESGLRLPGWSVTNLGPEPWWSRPVADWVARRVCRYADLADRDSDRRPWILTGRVIANGPDHEPLVVDLEPIGWVGSSAVAEATELYQQRFDVGRDSTGHKQPAASGITVDRSAVPTR